MGESEKSPQSMVKKKRIFDNDNSGSLFDDSPKRQRSNETAVATAVAVPEKSSADAKPPTRRRQFQGNENYIDFYNRETKEFFSVIKPFNSIKKFKSSYISIHGDLTYMEHDKASEKGRSKEKEEDSDDEEPENDARNDEQYCGSFWTPIEKEIFFGNLSRYSIHRIDMMMNNLPNKSKLEILNYYNLLEENLKNLKRRKRKFKKLIKITDIPISFEMSRSFIRMEESQAEMISNVERIRNNDTNQRDKNKLNRYIFKDIDELKSGSKLKIRSLILDGNFRKEIETNTKTGNGNEGKESKDDNGSQDDENEDEEKEEEEGETNTEEGDYEDEEDEIEDQEKEVTPSQQLKINNAKIFAEELEKLRSNLNEDSLINYGTAIDLSESLYLNNTITEPQSLRHIPKLSLETVKYLEDLIRFKLFDILSKIIKNKMSLTWSNKHVIDLNSESLLMNISKSHVHKAVHELSQDEPNPHYSINQYYRDLPKRLGVKIEGIKKRIIDNETYAKKFKVTEFSKMNDKGSNRNTLHETGVSEFVTESDLELDSSSDDDDADDDGGTEDVFGDGESSTPTISPNAPNVDQTVEETDDTDERIHLKLFEIESEQLDDFDLEKSRNYEHVLLTWMSTYNKPTLNSVEDAKAYLEAFDEESDDDSSSDTAPQLSAESSEDESGSAQDPQEDSVGDLEITSEMLYQHMFEFATYEK